MEALQHEQLKAKAEAVYATQPYERVSAKYKFFPTTNIVDMMKEHGWVPVRAFQTRPRTDADARKDKTKHAIWYRHMDYMGRGVGELLPEIIHYNSHEGNLANRFIGGIYRLVCGNGMVVNESTFPDMVFSHLRFDFAQVSSMLSEYIDTFPSIMSGIRTYQEIGLAPDEQVEFASRAMAIRWPKGTVLDATQLLAPRRSGDVGSDLWSTYNRIQENTMKGGLRKQITTEVDGRMVERTITSRDLKNAPDVINVNRDLWGLLVEFGARHL